MKQFSIKDIETLTGIKSHTIRIWEQRYSNISPQRTSTNIRYYNDDDLKLLLNVSLLNKRGVKISKIAKLSGSEMETIIMDYHDGSEDNSLQMHKMIVCMLHLDEVGFEKIISSAITMIGLERSVTELIFPFLHQVGVMWQSGSVNPAYEHFVTNLIRTKLIVATDAIGYLNYNKLENPGQKILLFLPAKETHELGLLFANYIFRSKGHHTMYLGADLPDSDVVSVLNTYNPDKIFTSVTTSLHLKTLRRVIDKLSLPDIKIPILISGGILKDHRIELPKNFHKIEKLNDLTPFL